MEHGVSAPHPARDLPEATALAERPEPRPRSGIASATLLMAGVVLGWLAILVLVLRLAALPPVASGKLLVLFAPGSAAEAFAAIVAAGGAPVRPVLGGLGWIAQADAPGFVARLEANGALAAYPGAPVGLTLAGCFAFATDPPHPLARTLDPRLAPGS